MSAEEPRKIKSKCVGGILNGCEVEHDASANCIGVVGESLDIKIYRKTRICFGFRRGEEVYLLEGNISCAEFKIIESTYT